VLSSTPGTELNFGVYSNFIWVKVNGVEDTVPSFVLSTADIKYQRRCRLCKRVLTLKVQYPHSHLRIKFVSLTVKSSGVVICQIMQHSDWAKYIKSIVWPVSFNSIMVTVAVSPVLCNHHACLP